MEIVKLETLEVGSEQDFRAAHPEMVFAEELPLDLVKELGYAVVEHDRQPQLAEGEALEYGPLRKEGERVFRGWVIISAAAPTAADIDSERDSRISAGFDFQGTHYQSRLPTAGQAGDWDVFSGKALEAFIAVSTGAQPGDMRWSDPSEDFAWIAADNSRVPMDAQTVIQLARAASQHRSRHTFAGSDLKAMQPIPVDFMDDKWWPA